MEKVTVIYIIAISLQLAGAVIVKKRYKEDMEIPYNSVASKADALPTEKEMDEIVEDVFKN